MIHIIQPQQYTNSPNVFKKGNIVENSNVRILVTDSVGENNHTGRFKGIVLEVIPAYTNDWRYKAFSYYDNWKNGDFTLTELSISLI